MYNVYLFDYLFIVFFISSHLQDRSDGLVNHHSPNRHEWQWHNDEIWKFNKSSHPYKIDRLQFRTSSQRRLDSNLFISYELKLILHNDYNTKTKHWTKDGFPNFLFFSTFISYPYKHPSIIEVTQPFVRLKTESRFV